MSSETKKWWLRSPQVNVLATLISTAILGIIKFIYDWYNQSEILPTLSGWLTLISESILYVLKFKIPTWVVCLLFIFYSTTYWLFDRKKRIKHIPENNVENEKSDVLKSVSSNAADSRLQSKLNYVSGRFNSYNWNWRWVYHEDLKEYKIEQLTPNCPNKTCKEIPLDFIENKGLMTKLYVCKNCNQLSTIYIYEGEVEEYILQNAKNL